MTDSAKPEYVTALETAFGPPSQAAFGSAVFYQPAQTDAALETEALHWYRTFVGDLWERYGEDAWMGTWQQVYTRPANTQSDIVTELRTLPDSEAARSASFMLDGTDNVGSAHAALSTAFDDAAVTELSVFKLGDGGAMSGILLAARRADAGEALYLIFLMD